MRWKASVFTLAMALAMMTGCAQRCWLDKQDWERFHMQNALPLGFETDTTISSRPTTDVPTTAPPTVLDPEREPRYISLAECIALALERGNTGIQSVRVPGGINEDPLPISPNGGPYQFVSSDNIRVLTLNPAVVGATIDEALARFDAKWVTSFGSGTTNQPIQGFNSFSNGDNGRFVSTLVKPLPTGGLAAVTWSTLYQDLTSPPTNFPLRNPAYTPRLQFTFEHSLWQSFGVDTNQLLSRPPLLGNLLSQIHPEASQYYQGHPLNLQNQGAGAGFNPSGILITRTRFDQSRADLERVVNYMLYNTEVAYWNLYGAYVSLYASEQALRFGYETYRQARSKYESGLAEFTVERVAQSRGQFEQFRGDRLQALDRVLEAERVLRVFLGLKANDGTRLVPVDAPTLAPYMPSWMTAWEEAMTLRPELVAARQELRALQFNLMVQQNFLKPDLRFVSQFGINGLGSSLSGDGQFFDQTQNVFQPDNAIRRLVSAHYNDWSLGLTLNIPIGFRFEHAAVRQAKVQLAQGYQAVKREENKVEMFLRKAYDDLFTAHGLVSRRRAQREAYAEQLEARFKLFKAGRKEATIEFVLQAQQQWANALNQEYQAIVQYNNALAQFQFAKGTIMMHDNVAISEGPIPQCAQVRAVEHERQRSHALVLRERANPIPHAPANADGVPYMPKLSNYEAPSLPALMDQKDLPPPEKLENAPRANPTTAMATEPRPAETKAPAAKPTEAKELHYSRPAIAPTQTEVAPELKKNAAAPIMDGLRLPPLPTLPTTTPALPMTPLPVVQSPYNTSAPLPQTTAMPMQSPYSASPLPTPPTPAPGLPLPTTP